MVETETKTETWKIFKSKTQDQDLKKFSRPRLRLGEFVRNRDDTLRPEILEGKLLFVLTIDNPFHGFSLNKRPIAIQ